MLVTKEDIANTMQVEANQEHNNGGRYGPFPFSLAYKDLFESVEAKIFGRQLLYEEESIKARADLI